MQTPEPLPPSRAAVDPLEPHPASRAPVPGYWGERLAWIAGLVLAVSAFTDWYSGSQADGLTLSVTGWHTGALGKLVFVELLGVAVTRLPSRGSLERRIALERRDLPFDACPLALEKLACACVVHAPSLPGISA